MGGAVIQLTASERAQLLALLEQRHGVGVRGAGSAGWLGQRIDAAIDDLGDRRGLDGPRIVDLLLADPSELAALADVLRVGETCLYRDPPQWDALRAHLDAAPPARLRGLSVGCSTGEEAWTLAMVLDAHGRGAPWRVVGVDRSEPALAVARAAVYPASSARHAPAELHRRYLVAREESLGVDPALHGRVSFALRDVTTGLPPGGYEIIVCKNLLIYFGHEAGTRLVDALMRALAPEGVLLVARSEVPRLRAMGHEGRTVAPGVTFFGPTAQGASRSG